MPALCAAVAARSFFTRSLVGVEAITMQGMSANVRPGDGQIAHVTTTMVNYVRLSMAVQNPTASAVIPRAHSVRPCLKRFMDTGS